VQKYQQQQVAASKPRDSGRNEATIGSEGTIADLHSATFQHVEHVFSHVPDNECRVNKTVVMTLTAFTVLSLLAALVLVVATLGPPFA